MTNRQRIDAELEKLTPIDREMVWMLYGYDRPEGYMGYLPASKAEAAEFLGMKYSSAPLTVRRIQQRMQTLLKMWAKTH